MHVIKIVSLFNKSNNNLLIDIFTIISSQSKSLKYTDVILFLNQICGCPSSSSARCKFTVCDCVGHLHTTFNHFDVRWTKDNFVYCNIVVAKINKNKIKLL